MFPKFIKRFATNADRNEPLAESMDRPEPTAALMPTDPHAAVSGQPDSGVLAPTNGALSDAQDEHASVVGSTVEVADECATPAAQQTPPSAGAVPDTLDAVIDAAPLLAAIRAIHHGAVGRTTGTTGGAPDERGSVPLIVPRGQHRKGRLDIPNLLCGIAWFGEMTTLQIGALWFPGYQERTVTDVLRGLAKDGLVRKRIQAELRALPNGQMVPHRQGAVWTLGTKGMAQSKDLDTFPRQYLGPRHPRMFNHDTVTTDTLITMIKRGREQHPALTGVYIEREARLNPPQPRPIMDAVISLRWGGEPIQPHVVPWVNRRAEPSERDLRFAIETDRDTEAISVIVGKAHAYRAAATKAWQARNGKFPIPIWVVPTRRRLWAILNAWAAADGWPQGKWLMTTDADMERDTWVEFYKGGLRERRLFAADADFVPFVPTTKPPVSSPGR